MRGDFAMTVFRLVVLISLVTLTATGQQNSPQQPLVPPASCRTVPPKEPFIPPAPYELDDSENGFWLGTEKLWTALPKSGNVWGWGPRAPGQPDLTAKTFWASVNFNYREEYPPKLKVTGKRLDGDAPPLMANRATNAFPGPAAAMLVGVYVPAPGCWEITGEYKGEKLSYVVWVQPVKQANE
jgi:hypothetical protein